MIDPTNVIKYDRTDAELQEWFLFSVVVAGKTATTMAKLLERFLSSLEGDTPFDRVRRAIDQGILEETLRANRIGRYNVLIKCFHEMFALDLRTCSVEDLEALHGIGPKTARMFIMHSRPNQRLAALDVHVLKHLRANGYPEAPETTPSSPALYNRLETAFLTLADRAGMAPNDYDLMIWKQYSGAHKEAA